MITIGERNKAKSVWSSVETEDFNNRLKKAKE